MNSSARRLFMGLTLALFFTLTLTALAQTDQSPNPPLHEIGASPAASAKAPANPAPTPPAPTPSVQPTPQPAPTPTVAATSPSAVTSSSSGTIITTSKDDVASGSDDDQPHAGLHRAPRHHGPGNDRVAVMNDTDVRADEHVEGDAVAVMGNLTVKGPVDGDAVCVMGESTIDSHVLGQAVCVMGDLHLGPHAIVDQDVVCVGGTVDRDPQSKVGGQVINQMGGFGANHLGAFLSEWSRRGPMLGRLLFFGKGCAPLWILTFGSLVFMILMTLVFPKAVNTCSDLISHRFGTVILTAFLGTVALPFLFILLLVTVIGIPIAFAILPAGIVIAKCLGVAGLFLIIGRALMGQGVHPALAILVVGIVFIFLAATPVIGLCIFGLVGFVGFGAAVAALLGTFKSGRAAKAAAVPRVTPVTPVQPVSPVTPAAAYAAPSDPSVQSADPTIDVTAVETPSAGAVPPPLAQPHVLLATLPRAGFWIRMVAMLIDVILVSVALESLLEVLSFHHTGHDACLTMTAIYAAIFWKLRGTTVGGLIFHLKVVRLDDRPIDWPTAVVRALGCFLSLIALGIGFIWIAFDEEKQAWHDKIAGTVVVQAPKGTPLV